jgi:signal transduction histidine kinase
MEIRTLNNQMKKWFPDIDVSKKPICYKVFNDPPREGVCSYCPTLETLKDGQTHQAITETPAGNETRNYKVISTPLRGKDGKVTAAIEMVEDITERKRAEEVRAGLEAQLRQAQKMEAVGTLASGIAHDFTNLLTAIFGYTDLAKATLPDDHPAIRALEMVEHSAMQARGVTDSLLTFSHRRGTEKRPINLLRTVGDTLRLLRRVMSPSIDVVQELSGEGDIWVNADATQIQQILMNLAVNGRDAMPDGGTLRVLLSREPAGRAVKGSPGTLGDRAEAVLVVEDTGVGMTKETRSRVFEPFFTTKPRGQGTGLGMSIIHGIVTDHGGQIDITSQPGRGTRVTVRLPCCAPPKKTAARQSRLPETRGHGEVIIIVEDDEHVRSIMTSTLRSRGYQVVPAANGTEALAALDDSRDSVRLVIFDVDLPNGEGLAMLQQARRRRSDLPFVVVTGGLEGDPAGQLAKQDCLLRKPFQMSGLTETVARSLTRPA